MFETLVALIVLTALLLFVIGVVGKVLFGNDGA